MVSDNNYRGHRPVDTSRRMIDIATGVLVGLRGYSEREAFEELAAAVRTTGVGIGSLAAALVSLIAGQPGPTLYRAEAMDVWGDLLAARMFSHATTLAAAHAS